MAGTPVAIIMGSQSDWATMRHAAEALDALGIPYDARIVSAHRTPDRLVAFAKGAKAAGFQVVIAGAGGAAHLPGMTAAMTSLPVFGVPVESKSLSGQDSLLSIVQMPAGIPVGTLAIGRAGAVNAALLAAAVLALHDEALSERLDAWRKRQTDGVAERPAEEAAMIVPGNTLGILGGGQLGRMIAMAAAQLGLRTHVYAPEADSPAFDVSAERTIAAYEDKEALAAFARSVDAITYEFENVPAATAALLGSLAPLAPNAKALAVSQDRLEEKNFIARLGIPTAPFAAVASEAELSEAVDRIGRPSVLKTRRFGYDGKGQVMIRAETDLAEAFKAVGGAASILEGFVLFERELSVIAARTAKGEFAAYDLCANEHRNHILDVTRVPAGVSAATEKRAVAIARAIADALDYVGVLAVELFLVRSPGR